MNKRNTLNNINKEKIIYFKYNIYIRLKMGIKNEYFLLNINKKLFAIFFIFKNKR